MSKLVILNLGKGNLQDGFPFVTARLQWGDKNMQFTGSLPAAADILDLYRRWQLLYELLYKTQSIDARGFSPQLVVGNDDIAVDSADITHISIEEFSGACQEIERKINNWLDDEGFRHIDRQVRKQLAPEDEIRFIIQTEDNHLRKLPWSTWYFFQDYPRAEVSLSSLNFEPKKQTQNKKNKVRILTILGDSTGIDIQADRKLLWQLPNAEVRFLVEPKRQEFSEQLWDRHGWDILFFAGHSSSEADGEQGSIYINPRESLTIPQLKNALNKAIERGLQIAIFNSCEGLGLARQIADLQIPQTIVMREPVPDKVAQEFLKHFLKIFAEGQSFYLSVREARERLQGIEGEFPGASWLPVIVQNPAEISPTWKQLRGQLKSNSQPIVSSFQPTLLAVSIDTLVVTALVMGLRWLGIFQGIELKAFDEFMRHRPLESADSSLLIVGASEEDIGGSGYGYPLPDEVLVRLSEKLKQYRPAAIGIDIFRDAPVPKDKPENHRALIASLQRDKNLVAVCAGKNLQGSTAAPPPKISPQRIGFADLLNDDDGIVRRYLLSRSSNPVEPPSHCITPYSFAWQLAYRYLRAKNVSVTTRGKDWQFGSIILDRLQESSGGYQNLDARGNQLLINYRNTPQIAQQVTIKDVLEHTHDFNPAWVKGRVVLIGITAASVHDTHDTPYGKMRGLFIHAHAISQIIDAVEGERALLWWLPKWGDTLWVLCWAFVGSAISLFEPKPITRRVTQILSILILSGTCWLLLSRGGWMPFIPSLFALVFAGGAMKIYICLLQKNNFMLRKI